MSLSSLTESVSSAERCRRRDGKIGVKNDGRGSIDDAGVGGFRRPARRHLVSANDKEDMSGLVKERDPSMVSISEQDRQCFTRYRNQTDLVQCSFAMSRRIAVPDPSQACRNRS
jgi:hypothetical protein